MASRKVQHGANLKDSFVLDEQSSTHFADVKNGSLSVKWLASGGAWYELEGTRIRLEGPRFLLLNHGQPYKIEVEEPVESFCVFFGAGFVEDVRRTLASPPDSLLDEPWADMDSVSVADRLYPDVGGVIPRLMRLRDSARSGGVAELEFGMRELAESVLNSQVKVQQEVSALSAARVSTREELYRRLYRARDFMDSHLHTSLQLHEAARAACLSPHHFHRSFREAFSVTPHDYVTNRRMEKARNLLLTSRIPVVDVCAAVGFESYPSFSLLFRRLQGISPGQFRKIR